MSIPRVVIRLGAASGERVGHNGQLTALSPRRPGPKPVSRASPATRPGTRGLGWDLGTPARWMLTPAQHKHHRFSFYRPIQPTLNQSLHGETLVEKTKNENSSCFCIAVNKCIDPPLPTEICDRYRQYCWHHGGLWQIILNVHCADGKTSVWWKVWPEAMELTRPPQKHLSSSATMSTVTCPRAKQHTQFTVYKMPLCTLVCGHMGPLPDPGWAI